jgi:hypothetical protein
MNIHYKLKLSTIVKMNIDSLYYPENSVYIKILIMNLQHSELNESLDSPNFLHKSYSPLPLYV